MKLFVLGLRRSGTTILLDALREDPTLRCFYEPLREDDPTEGGGSGARAGDAFAETRELRRRFRDQHFPELELEEFNWGGPRAPELELELELPEHVRGLIAHLLEQAGEVAIKETRLSHKLAAVAEIAPEAGLVHVVRDPRAVTASMLLGRRRRVDLYPDAGAFFTARTRRRLWSSREISELLAGRLPPPGLPADLPDFLRPLLVWRAAVEATAEAGARHYAERYRTVRLEDLRLEPRIELDRIYELIGREPPAGVVSWAEANLRRDPALRHGDDPRWARAARLLRMEQALEATGYGEILELEPGSQVELDLEPPPPPSRLSAAIGRARRQFDRGQGGRGPR